MEAREKRTYLEEKENCPRQIFVLNAEKQLE